MTMMEIWICMLPAVRFPRANMKREIVGCGAIMAMGRLPTLQRKQV